jgi:hypothetical protein
MVDFVPFLLFYSTSKSPKFEPETNRYEEGDTPYIPYG